MGKRKSKFTMGHGGMIIQLRAANFEKNPKCPNTGIFANQGY